jgi:ankyrin repeat protein
MIKKILIISVLIFFSFSQCTDISDQEKKKFNEQFLKTVEANDLKAVSELIDSGKIDINTVDKYGNTALIFAMWNNNLEMMRKLLDSKIDINHQDDLGMTPLRYLLGISPEYDKVEWSKKKPMIKLLLEYKANKEIKDKFGKSALSYANDSNEHMLLLLSKTAP